MMGGHSNPYESPKTAPPADDSAEKPGNTAVVTPEIMFRAYEIHHRTRLLIRYIVYMAICVALTGLGVVYWNSGMSTFAGLLWGLAACFLILLLLTGRRLRRAVVNQYEQMGKRQEVATFETTPDYLQIATDDVDTRIKWSAFAKWTEVDGLILAYRHDQLFQVIPIDQLDITIQQAIRHGLQTHSRKV